MTRVRDLLHDGDVYRDFPHRDYKLDVSGWDSAAAIFERLIVERKPRLIVEVGTWKGASALHMAQLLRKTGIADGEIVCVDTWLGSTEHWLERDNPKSFAWMARRHGRPILYEQFLANVIKAGYSNTITPLPASSRAGAGVLATLGVQADLIYLDAGHDYFDVTGDVAAFWPLVRPGGVLLGDDYVVHWPGVMRAAREFAARNQLVLNTDGTKWYVVKPG